ncbi:MAG: hypothetical protein ABII82_02340 [Verrucomicrobiota bacterium]
MKAPQSSLDEAILRDLVDETDESATAALFLRLCRQSPELRHWLTEEFGRSAQVRKKFNARLKDPEANPPRTFIELSEEAPARRQVFEQLREQMPARRYGGLTWSEVVALTREYQAATVDPGVFMLAHDWGRTGEPSPATMKAGLDLLQAVIPSGRRRALKHLNKALTFLKAYRDKSTRRTALGYGDWWKLQLLFYILKHPSDSYRTRELRAHLLAREIEVSTKEIRRFCTRHGIRRDVRAGRPRRVSGGIQ